MDNISSDSDDQDNNNNNNSNSSNSDCEKTESRQVDQFNVPTVEVSFHDFSFISFHQLLTFFVFLTVIGIIIYYSSCNIIFIN